MEAPVAVDGSGLACTISLSAAGRHAFSRRHIRDEIAQENIGGTVGRAPT
jgi:hypothetical protein